VTFFWLGQHEPAKALAFIQPFPRDFLEDHFVELPKGYLVGKAYAQAGDLAAARLEWRKALEGVNRRLALNPEKPRLIHCKACLHSLLGEDDEAEKQAEVYQQLTKLDDPETVLVGTLTLLMEMGRVQNAISLIRNNPKMFPANRLRRYASIYPIVGSAPQFQAELASIEAQGEPAKKDGATNQQSGSAGSPNTNSVAVLPFVNLSPDKTDEYLSDGMTEELLNALSRVEGLRVPGRSSSFAFKGKTEEDLFRKVGEQLHVGAVLEGSVRKAANQLRITTRLIKVADGFPLWSEEYDRDMTNIFAIQSDIAGRVAEALKVRLLSAGTQPRKPTENIEAYKLYLQGRQLWNRRTSRAITQAINCFNQAIAADPAYALAYSGLADCYAILSDYSGAPLREVAPKTRAAALKAIQLDETLGEPHAALGITKANLDWDWPGAEAEFRRAIELNPNYATTHHWFGNVLGSQEKFKEALAEYQRAQELDPLSDIINAMVARGLFATGREELAIQMLQRQMALHSDFEPFHNALGEFYLVKGKLPEAIHELETALQIDKENPAEWGLRGFAYAHAGRVIDAQSLLSELASMRRQGQNVTVEMSWIQHGLGNDSQALDSLEQASEDRAIQLPEPLTSPLWKDLRPNPRAQAILRQMHLIQ
jgi:TolB-like protein/Tfp pilus assembly protein PilF